MKKSEVVLKWSFSIVILLAGFFVCNCKDSIEESAYYKPEILATHFNGEKFVGSMVCKECHSDIYASHVHTAHYNTSSIADSSTVKGSFKEGLNRLTLENVEFEMKSQNDTLFQSTTIKNRSTKVPKSSFDIVIGSGVKGQSYLNWEQNELFQMQVSYYTPGDKWVNSPSFPNYSYSRPIGDACLKCHMTFATNNNIPKKINSYNREQMVYGIDCERCHRPGEKHVVYHRQNPQDKEGMYMPKLQELSKQQRLGACAQCHSGLRQELLKGTPFSFLTGNDLNDFSKNYDQGVSNEELDVHGNQYGLLTSSQCFKKSDIMDCTTCHNPHSNQRGKSNYFNAKCISCHSNSNSCKADDKKRTVAHNNCIECHMPTKASNAMMVQLNKDSLETSFYVRTHLIGVYSEEEP